MQNKTNIGIGSYIRAKGPEDWALTGRIVDMSYESGYVTFTVQDVNGDQHTIGTGGHLGDHFVNDGEQPGPHRPDCRYEL